MSRKPVLPSPADGDETREGLVVRSVGASIRVRAADGSACACIVRGRLRMQDIQTTNPVAVGDRVLFRPPADDDTGVILDVLPRKNYILRKAIAQAHKVHMLAANVDQALLVFTIDHPPTSMGFADRFLVVNEAYRIPVRIVINKIDLLTTPEQLERLALVRDTYTRIGYEVHALSATDPAYRPQVGALLHDKVSFIGGHSGTGKSALVNLIDPALDLRTGDISAYSGKGKHTTTYAEMHTLAGGGFLIDSPGIKELGIAGFGAAELSHYFPEMLARLPDCRFNDCTHRNEPGCVVRAALDAGEIAPSRYKSYLSMLAEV
ncbi:MAG: ribosome small subunit-dependent GTPase A [Bacteroidia bacterium]